MALRLAAKLAAIRVGARPASLPSRRFFNPRPTGASGTGGGRRGAFYTTAATVAACGSAAVYFEYRRSAAAHASSGSVAAAAPAAATAEPPERGLNWRERHFLAHASLQYEAVAYLSPLDFLESVALLGDTGDGAESTAEATPPLHKQKMASKKRHKRRRVLAEADYRAMIRATPRKRRASDHLFRDIGANGLISYPEFLLLLNVLNKSTYGFEVAFRAFDRNSDSRLDVEEFRQLYRVVSGANSPDSSSTELLCNGSSSQADCAAPATSLLVHFFGSDCRDSLSAADFTRFADNLQREVLLVEFKSCCGQTSTTMTPVDFGRAVLRRTRLSGSDRRLRISLLEERVWHSDGVTAEEYRQFFQFLLHMEDLFFALRMFDIAGKSIDQDDFQRAVKAVTGQCVSPKLLTIVFALFDINGDGALSYSEFIDLFGHQDSILKYHSIAGIEEADSESGWERYRKCIKKYMLLQQ